MTYGVARYLGISPPQSNQRGIEIGPGGAVLYLEYEASIEPAWD